MEGTVDHDYVFQSPPSLTKCFVNVRRTGKETFIAPSINRITSTNCAYLLDDIAFFASGENQTDLTKAYEVTLNDGATAQRTGGAAIGNGHATIYADGFSYGGTEYFQKNATVTLGFDLAGYTLLGYTVSGATLGEDNTFTMPDHGVTVTALSARLTAHQATYADQTRYWTTFYHPNYNYQLPAGAQAFTMDSEHALYRVGDGSIIPAGCAVVIVSDASELTMTMTGSGATPKEGNILRGTSAATAAPANAYVLSKEGETFGFFKYTGEIPANKAYYVE
jgi:hypothetical protein